MRVISRKPLQEFWEARPDVQGPLEAWFHEVRKAEGSSLVDVKRQFSKASIIGHNRVVFDLGGNKYRLVVEINYGIGIVFVRFIGRHQEYDQIVAREVKQW